MLTIVSALKSELEYLLEKSVSHQKIKIENGSLYLGSNFHFLRTGPGREKTNQVINEYLKQYHPNKIINIGTAGALHNKMQSGKIYQISEIVLEKNNEKIPLNSLPELEEQTAALLLTVDQPVQDEKLRNRLAEKYGTDLVDMEGFYLAASADLFNIPFYSVKIITDFANQTTQSDFLKNYKRYSDLLGKYIFEKIIGN